MGASLLKVLLRSNSKFFLFARSIPTFLKYKLTKFHFYTMKGSSFFSHSKSINFRPPLNRDVPAAWLPKRTKSSREKYK